MTVSHLSEGLWTVSHLSNGLLTVSHLSEGLQGCNDVRVLDLYVGKVSDAVAPVHRHLILPLLFPLTL